MKPLFILMALLSVRVYAQEPDAVFLEHLLQSNPQLFQHVLDHPTHNEVQILYTQIDRDEHNIPHFTTYTYRLNPKHYFYPASTVKLPTAIFALEKINELNINGLDKNTEMVTDSVSPGEVRVSKDPTARDGKPSIAQYIKRILLVSDNNAYNRLYEFVGRGEINNRLRYYGLSHSRIIGRLAVGDGGASARMTNPIRFYNAKNMLIYDPPPQYDGLDYPMHLDNMVIGKGYIDRNDKLVMKPFDLSDKNVYPLEDQQLVLKKLLFPEAFPKSERFNLKDEDYKFLYRYMSMYPTESDYPKYKSPEYYPAYCKFIYYGGESNAAVNPDIRIFNKVGDSYGFDIDNTYVVDFKNKVEFLLSAVVQSNDDGIYNDDKYEYQTVCLPFLKNLGQVIYQYELKRPREHQPDLSKFKFKY